MFHLSRFGCIAALICCTLICDRAEGGLIINIGGNELSSSGAGSIDSDAIVLEFSDLAANTVGLKITVNSDANKIKDIVFNVDNAFPTSLFPVSSSNFKFVSGVEAEAISRGADPGFDDVGLGTQGLKGFDILFSYGTSGSSGSLFTGEVSEYELTAPNLMASHFNVLTADGLLAGAKINLPNGMEPSGKYANTSTTVTPPNPELNPVPEPISLAIWSCMGVLGCSRLSRKRGNRRDVEK